MAMLLRLQNGPATARELADGLEVSMRTIYRDVAALQTAGVPLWTETGAHGGIRLLEGWRTRLDGLTGDEAGALFFAGAPAVADELGLGALLLAAEAKVMTTLPPELRARADRVRSRFHLDAPGWFHPEESNDQLATVAEAVWAGRRLDARYERGSEVVSRRLDPLGLVLKGGIWYLVATHRGHIRTWRVSRIVSARICPDEFDRPAGFDLASWWGRSAAEFDRSVLHYRCRLRLSPWALRCLPQFANPSPATAAVERAGEPDEHGWRIVDLEGESEEVVAVQLCGLAPGLEVLEPPSLRAALSDIGTELAARNA
jgi:predicted DNA-binding transcriptional regulator YafY